MPRSGFHTLTLGCKLNQFDTAAIEGELTRRGLRPQADPAQAAVVVINTCTVTGKADVEARKLVRRIRRDNADCRLLVTGCYAELDAPAIESIEGVDLVFGNREKPRLAELLDRLDVGAVGTARVPGWHATEDSLGDRGCDWPLALPEALHFGERSRAFLKVQEGCDLTCSYCVIPQVRGPSRSVPPEILGRAVERLVRSGYHEIVLTGVNTGDYGKDLSPRSSLARLLTRLAEQRGPARIRLNSLEPRTVSDEVIRLLTEQPGLAPHLQVPLQSGCDAVLKRMRRNYRTPLYLERLQRLREAVPEIGLGADVIVGFPGETEAEFAQTERFIADSPLNYLHVFSWSERPGTPAAALDARVPGPVVRRRSARLRELAATLGHRFRRGFVGRRLEAVVLGSRGGGTSGRALTGNFIDVALDGGTPATPGTLVQVRITGAERETTHGVVEAGG